MVQNQVRVVVVGAGYAGLLATVRLAGKVRSEIRSGRVAITLVNAADVFVERPRLHQFAANKPVHWRPISNVLRDTGVAFVQGTVTSMDLRRRRLEVQTQAGLQPVDYDQLLYALGSTMDLDRMRGVREFAYALTPSGTNSAEALRLALPALNARSDGGRLLICGGGATGIESAAEFAAAYPNLRVQLVTEGAFGHGFATKVAAYMRDSLAGLGVTVQDHTTIVELQQAAALPATGEPIPFDLCLWTGGFTVPRLAREAGLAVNERGQVLIDPFMRSVSHPEVHACGDAAAPVEPPGVSAVRMAALTAAITGAHAADCLAAALRHRAPQPLSFAYLGQGIALGPGNAIGFNNYPDDRPTPPYFTGRLGFEGREFFVRLLADLASLEQRWPGATVWLGKGRYAAQKRHANLGAPRARRSSP